MSNIAPHSRFKFQKNRHFLRQDIIFAQPGAHILLKWTKTLQQSNAHHFVQIPVLSNSVICRVRALTALLASRNTPSDSPLFAHINPPHLPVIDTTIRDALRKILDHIGIPSLGHGFHTFRHSGATLAAYYGTWPLEKFSCMDIPPERLLGSFHHSSYFCICHPSTSLVWVWAFKFPNNLKILKILNCTVCNFTNV